MLKNGEVLGFSILLRSEVETSAVRGIIMVSIGSKALEPIIARLNRLPEIQAVHTTSGKWDLVLEVGTESVQALDSVLKRLRETDGVLESETSIFLATKHGTPTRRPEKRI